MLTQNEITRYNRHIVLPGFGKEAQEKLKNAKVLIVGAGGLGSPVLYYLTAMGVGNIGIVENDTINQDNLQRQILYSTNLIGENKIEQAKVCLTDLNPGCKIDMYCTRFDNNNGIEIAENYHILVDCSDNYATRYVSDSVSKQLNIPFVYASVRHFEGQLSVFNYNKGLSYTDLFPEPPEIDPDDFSEKGVVGVLPGIIGTMQAAEVIKIITGIGEVLSGKLLIYNLLKNKFQLVTL